MGISLVKEKAAAVGVSLKKKGVTTVPPMRVTAVFDVSGSMTGNVRSGALQKAADQVLGVAYKLDDNGEVEVFVFDDRVAQAPTMTVEDFGTYIDHKIVAKGLFTAGSTRYDSALKAVIDFLFASKGAGGLFGFAKPKVVDNSPALVLFFTDGSPDHGDQADRVLNAARGKNVYFQMIGVGDANFSVLDALADEFDNVGMVRLRGFSMSDEAIYDQLVTDEFVAFLKAHGAA